MAIYQATVSAPVNIAVVKYWGKRNTDLILPTNDSLSVTLDQDQLQSKTTVRSDASYDSDRLWLNGQEEVIKPGGRLAKCISELRVMRQPLEANDSSLPTLSQWGLHIASENNFPTAAGLASSASGFAALTYAIATLFNLPAAYSDSELTRVARQGSGSACRSLMGGFVAWQQGESDDGKDSMAVSVAEQQHWPTLQALICVVSDAKKGTPSTAGMQQSVATSALLAHRIKQVVPQRMDDMRAAIAAKDFDRFAQLTMADSNNFHACCLDTQPPIFYMNDTSRAVIQLIEELNRASIASGGKRIVGYTYDAGPNSVLYHERTHAPLVLGLIRHYFPSAALDDTFNLLGKGANASFRGPQAEVGLPEGLPQGFNPNVIPIQPVGAVSRLIHTQVGPGPQVIEAIPTQATEPKQDNGQTGLLNLEGLPIRLQRTKRE